MRSMIAALLVLGLVAALARADDGKEEQGGRQEAGEGGAALIATGWDSPTPARWRRELPAFERLGVFHGSTIRPTRRVEGGDVSANSAFTADPWTWAEFAPAVEELKAARSETVTQTFLLVNANPDKAERGVDWFDDAGWAQIVDHWRLLARAARAGGMRGLAFDAEPYTPPFAQFNYAVQPGRAQHTFAQYAAKARERGSAVMRAVGEEFPACVIFTYRLLSDLGSEARAAGAGAGDVAALLATDTFGLLPAFLDGWLDALPPGVRIVEGNEDAYRFNSRAEFERAYTELRTASPRLLAPENRAKYRAQVDVGHGFYIDAYANPPGDAWYIDPKGTTPAARLEANVSDALRASDGWVWINGESGRWWAGGNAKYPTWDERIQGASAALVRAARPLAATAAALDHAGTENLLSNGAFAEADADGKPTHWWTWQPDTSAGKFALAAGGGAAEVRGATRACFGQTISAKRGATYAVCVRLRSRGSGAATAWVRWKAAAGQWVEGEDIALTPLGPPDTDGWRRHTALVRPPDSADKIVLLLAADAQGDDGAAGFAEARIVECGPER